MSNATDLARIIDELYPEPQAVIAQLTALAQRIETTAESAPFHYRAEDAADIRRLLELVMTRGS